MKIPRRNGQKRKKITCLVKHLVASTYKEDEKDAKSHEATIDWISYRFPAEYVEVGQDANNKPILERTPHHYYDVGNVRVDGKSRFTLKTPNSKNKEKLEGVVYNSVEIIAYSRSPHNLANALGLELARNGYFISIIESDNSS